MYLQLVLRYNQVREELTMVDQIAESHESNNMVWSFLHQKYGCLDRLSDFFALQDMNGVKWLYLDDLIEDHYEISEDIMWLTTFGHENLIF